MIIDTILDILYIVSVAIAAGITIGGGTSLAINAYADYKARRGGA